jgi:hypothetical protein
MNLALFDYIIVRLLGHLTSYVCMIMHAETCAETQHKQCHAIETKLRPLGLLLGSFHIV